MIASLTGTVSALTPEELTLEVSGVGYRVQVPVSVSDQLTEGQETKLFTSTYIREDRFDLFGFLEASGRMLFEHFIAMNGIGPKSALELCAVPKSLLMQAVGTQDAKLLTNVKGIGKKTAEKLLVDLKALAEKHPEIFSASGEKPTTNNAYDLDAIEALKALGYDTATIMQALEGLPEDLKTTEDRVTAALRSL